MIDYATEWAVTETVENGIGGEVIIARFFYEDDAKAFLSSARRRKPWATHRLQQTAPATA